MLRSIGFNGYGHSIKVRRRIYECFARPKIEYCLCILPINKEIDRIIEVAQHQALATIFSVHTNAGYVALEELAGITPMPVRHETLNASWKARIATLNRQFMIYHAKVHSRENPISLFKIAETNPTRTWERYKFKTVWQGTPLNSVSVSGRMKPILEIRKWRERIASRERRNSKPAQTLLIHQSRMATAKAIDKIPSNQGRRIVTLWILKKLVGAPRTVQKLQ